MSSGGFSQDLRQRQTQSLVQAPQLRQSRKILRVGALHLRSVIQEELQANPTLEEEPMEGMSAEKPEPDNGNADANGDDAAASAEGTPEQAPDAKGDEMDFSKEFEILGKIDDDWRDYMANAGAPSPTPPRMPSAASISLIRSRPRRPCRNTSCGRRK